MQARGLRLRVWAVALWASIQPTCGPLMDWAKMGFPSSFFPQFCCFCTVITGEGWQCYIQNTKTKMDRYRRTQLVQDIATVTCPFFFKQTLRICIVPEIMYVSNKQLGIVIIPSKHVCALQ
jgi:hypothetical protein